LIVVTNQPDVARGPQSQSTVEAMHDRLREALPVDDIIACFHDDSADCACRKPRPGLLLSAQGKYGVEFAWSFLIGDRWKDIDAGHEAGCKTVLIDRQYRERPSTAAPNARVATLSAAVDWIEQQVSNGGGKMPKVDELKVKIFADGADKATMIELSGRSYIRGLTTNPTLMRQAGITNYEAFAREVLEAIPDLPISFEVFADDFDEMESQAKQIAGWGSNVYVKIPVTNTKGQPALDLVNRLAHAGVKLNVTAILTLDQVRDVSQALAGGAPACVSVFAGRIADTGRDPVPLMTSAVEYLRPHPAMELIWASPRELLNVFQADEIGCHIITVTPDILKKLTLVGKDLSEFSLETVRMFYDDARKAGFALTPVGTPQRTASLVAGD
jgi:transaldolase